MKSFARRALLSSAATAALVLAAAPAAAETTWITIGERAWALLAAQAPQLRPLASREVAVDVPAGPRARRTVRGTETVHAVELDDALLPPLSEAVHAQLSHCGGFIRHASMAEALAALHRIDGLPAPETAPSYALDDGAEVARLMPSLNPDKLLFVIQKLETFQNRRYNSTYGAQASDWLFRYWNSLAPALSPRPPRVRQIAHSGWGQKSVELVIPGSGPNASEVVVIGAHLDSTGPGGAEGRNPGADDDASGVATMTEVIRVLLAGNYRPSRTLRFIAYAAEEAGLLGSNEIAQATLLAGTPVVGVFQLDMDAYQGDPQDVWLIGDYTNAAQNQFVVDLAAAYAPTLSVTYDVCGYACSDHASWHNRGFAASFPFESSFAHFNPGYHSANDTSANFGGTAAHAIKFAKLELAYVVELGSD